jgi:hypothetical protein
VTLKVDHSPALVGGHDEDKQDMLARVRDRDVRQILGPSRACSARSAIPRPGLRAAVALAMGLTACSAAKPVLYPNAHFQTVGQEGADRDIEECKEMARAAGADRNTGAAGEVATGTAVGAAVGAAGGAVGGAISGGPGIGAAIGAASGAVVGALSTMIGRRSTPSSAYTNFVDRCLRDKGYEPTGWN